MKVIEGRIVGVEEHKGGAKEGRPPLQPGGKQLHRRICMDDGTFDALQQLAMEYGCSLSQMVRDLIWEEVRRG